MLKGKNAVITGATRGIGREIAIHLAKNGANISINYRKENEDLLSLIDIIKEYGVKVIATKCDVSKSLEVNNFIKELIDKINSSDIRDFQLEFKDIKLSLSKNEINTYNPKSEQAVNEKREVIKNITEVEVKEEIVVSKPERVEFHNEVKSPLVGVYYSSSAPGKAPYVEVGSKVKKGDVLCIIEAMKIMNEVTSEFDGEIVEVLKNDEDFVEFSTPLFKIR